MRGPRRPGALCTWPGMWVPWQPAAQAGVGRLSRLSQDGSLRWEHGQGMRGGGSGEPGEGVAPSGSSGRSPVLPRPTWLRWRRASGRGRDRGPMLATGIGAGLLVQWSGWGPGVGARGRGHRRGQGAGGELRCVVREGAAVVPFVSLRGPQA